MSNTLNTLIPMEDEAGNRCFVNNWDVQARKAEGWKVVGKLEHHTASTKAPVESLSDGDKPPAPAEKTKSGKAKKNEAGEASSESPQA